MAKLIQVYNAASQETKLCVRPLTHFVSNEGGTKWFYFCPVCCKTGAVLGVDEGDSNCSFCGINLFWDEPEYDGRGWHPVDD